MDWSRSQRFHRHVLHYAYDVLVRGGNIHCFQRHSPLPPLAEGHVHVHTLLPGGSHRGFETYPLHMRVNAQWYVHGSVERVLYMCEPSSSWRDDMQDLRNASVGSSTRNQSHGIRMVRTRLPGSYIFGPASAALDRIISTFRGLVSALEQNGEQREKAYEENAKVFVFSAI